MYYYRIKRYGPAAQDRYSIDLVTARGEFIQQVAFWFAGRGAAVRRLAELIAEDAAQGLESQEWHWTEADHAIV